MKYVLFMMTAGILFANTVYAKPELTVGVNCKSYTGYQVALSPVDFGNRIEIALTSPEGHLLDDNRYTLTKSVFINGHQGLIAEEEFSGIRLEIWNLNKENIGAIRVQYRNNLLQVDEVFSKCDIQD